MGRRRGPGWAKSIALHIPYGQTGVSGVPLPKGCERHAFIHIGYADQAQPPDVYGHQGPVIGPTRLAETIATLKAQGMTGFMAYSEGVYEDVNKALLAGITSGQYDTPGAALEAYATRYFGAEGGAAAQWAAWLEQWSRPFDADAVQAGKDLEALTRGLPVDNWRLQQLPDGGAAPPYAAADRMNCPQSPPSNRRSHCRSHARPCT